MHFYQRIDPTNLNINYKGQEIENVHNTEFLRIIIDGQLTWKAQAEELRKKT